MLVGIGMAFTVLFFVFLLVTHLRWKEVKYSYKSQQGLQKAMLVAASIIYFLHLTVMSIVLITALVKTNYAYERDYGSQWDLSVKASTLKLKSDYIKSFHSAILNNRSDFVDSSAIWLRTPNEDLDKNLETLGSLVQRLEAIQGMDENSLAYQTAMQQITGQEQDEAYATLRVIFDCYRMHKSMFFHGGFELLLILSIMMAFLSGIFIVAIPSAIFGE